MSGQESRKRPRPGPRGRVASDDARQAVLALLRDAGLAEMRRDRLIEQLHVLQNSAGCLREGDLVALAALHRLAPVEVFETASFYAHFKILPDDAPAPPEATLRICDGLPCMMAGAHRLQPARASLRRPALEPATGRPWRR